MREDMWKEGGSSRIERCQKRFRALLNIYVLGLQRAKHFYKVL